MVPSLSARFHIGFFLTVSGTDISMALMCIPLILNKTYGESLEEIKAKLGSKAVMKSRFWQTTSPAPNGTGPVPYS
jgi:hypothetical protein